MSLLYLFLRDETARPQSSMPFTAILVPVAAVL